MDTSRIREAVQSERFKKIIKVFGLALAVLIIFAIGMEVGYIKAGFSYKSGDNYYQAFGKAGDHMMGFVPGDVSDAHGVSGTIISVSASGLVIENTDNTEKAVTFDDDTAVRELRNTITVSDLKIGDFIVVIGNPDANGDIDAKFIRVLPPPPPAATPGQQTATATPAVTTQQ